MCLQLSEKPHPGFRLRTSDLHRGFAVANSNTSTGLHAFLYDFCNGPRIRTYNRDGFTGLDYADQRFYASNYGRFNTPDPYRASAGAADPGSWNRYSYVQGDPTNHTDRHGLFIDGLPTIENCGPNWMTDASLSGPCTSDSGTGQGGSGSDDDTGSWLTQQLGVGYVYAFLPDPNTTHGQILNKVKTQLRQSLAGNLKCLTWLKGGVAGGSQASFDKMWSSVTIGSEIFLGGGQTNAVFGAPNSGYQISINGGASGAAFGGGGLAYVGSQWTPLINSLQPGSFGAQEFTLLHELAHYFRASGFGADANSGNPDQDITLQKNNNNLLLQNCSGIFTSGVI